MHGTVALTNMPHSLTNDLSSRLLDFKSRASQKRAPNGRHAACANEVVPASAPLARI
jgi:hypothetical protein